MKKIFSIVIIGLTLTACGFQPMYGTASRGNSSIESVLAQVEIGNIPDREGQFLRNDLIDRFYADGRPVSPKYLLAIEPIHETTRDLDITKSSDATRAQLRLETQMALKDMSTGEIVLKRKLTAISSYNVLTSEFATRVSEQNMRENGLKDLARQIELQVGLYFKR